MPKASNASRITRGYGPDRKAVARLKAVGVRTVYCGADGEVPGKFRLRKGETLGVVDGLRAFGSQRKEMAAAVKLVHSWGATIVDIDHGENSRDHALDMLDRALLSRPLSPEKAAEMAKLSAKVRNKNKWPADRAERKWFDPAIKDPETFTALTGWPESTAYAKFGPRFARTKRPRKQK